MKIIGILMAVVKVNTDKNDVFREGQKKSKNKI